MKDSERMKKAAELAKSFEEIFGDPAELAKSFKEIFGDPKGFVEKAIRGQATEEEFKANIKYAKHQLKIFGAAIREVKKILKEAEQKKK